MNAPVYFMLHAFPVVLLLGCVSFAVGVVLGKKLWKRGSEQAVQFQAEFREAERKIAAIQQRGEEGNAV